MYLHFSGPPAIPTTRQRRHASIDFRDTFAIRDGVFLHAENSIDEIAGRERWVLRSNHAAHSSGAHNFTDPDRCYVRPALIHPAAHRRIERDVKDFHQEIAV